ncbi:hypothetical protein EV426DRAFT_709034 [Tirmania nivea]|nr:hypothetical protein EV426DRAFT_709034 [Tirmania nivea]
MGISGNEKADRRAAYESALGRIAGSQQAATGAGIRIAAKARQKDTQTEPGFELHFVRKVDFLAYPNCNHRSKHSYHITFDCPHHCQQRQELIGNARTWEDLDTPIWRKEEGEAEEWDAVEMYFAYLYRSIGK